MTVSKRTRYEVLKRDNHTCRYCGDAAPDATLTIDHVLPVSLGGTDNPENLVAACVSCNFGKGSSSPDAALVEDVKTADLKWAGAMKRAAELMAEQRMQRRDYLIAFDEVWTEHGRKANAEDQEWGLTRLYEAGLPLEEMLDAAEASATARGVYDRFNYFMGICWKKVTTLQETAKELLAADEAGDE